MQTLRRLNETILSYTRDPFLHDENHLPLAYAYDAFMTVRIFINDNCNVLDFSRIDEILTALLV